MVDVPSHFGIFAVRGLIHRVSEFVLSIEVRIFSRDNFSFLPDLVNAFLRKITHSITLFSFSSALVFEA